MTSIATIDGKSHLHQAGLYKPIGRQRRRLGGPVYIAQAMLFVCTLAGALYPDGLGHTIGLAGYIGFCVFAFVAVRTLPFGVSLGCLTVIAAYEPVTAYLYPGLTTTFVAGYLLVLTSLLIDRRKRVTVVSAVFGAVALLCMWRFLVTGLANEASAAVRYIAATAGCVCFSTSRLCREDYVKILAALGVALSAVTAISIIAAAFGGRLGPEAFVDGGVRLGQLNGLGANSFAYFCSMGLLSGAALALHRRSALIATLIVLVCGSGLILSKSLGSLLPIAVAATALLILSGNFSRRVLGRQIVGILLLSIGIVVLWRYDFFSLSARDLQTFTGRTVAWAYSLEMIAANPLLGADSRTFAMHATEIAYTDSNEVALQAYLTPHNIALAAIAYYGVVLGTALLVVQVGKLGKALTRAVKSDLGAVAIVFIPLVGFLIHMSIDAWYFLYWWLFVVFAVPRLPRLVCTPRAVVRNPELPN